MLDILTPLLKGLKNANDMTSFTKIPSFEIFKNAVSGLPYKSTDIEAVLRNDVASIETIELQVKMNDFIFELSRLIGTEIGYSEEALCKAYNMLFNRPASIVNEYFNVNKSSDRHVSVQEVLETSFPKVLENTDEVYIGIMISLLETKIESIQIGGN